MHFFWFNVGRDGDMLLLTYIVAYESLIYQTCAFYIHLLYCMDIWILVDMVATKII